MYLLRELDVFENADATPTSRVVCVLRVGTAET
jgi:hypothetical protein